MGVVGWGVLVLGNSTRMASQTCQGTLELIPFFHPSTSFVGLYSKTCIHPLQYTFHSLIHTSFALKKKKQHTQNRDYFLAHVHETTEPCIVLVVD